MDHDREKAKERERGRQRAEIRPELAHPMMTGLIPRDGDRRTPEHVLDILPGSHFARPSAVPRPGPRTSPEWVPREPRTLANNDFSAGRWRA
jgi:hypothetical protein